ncbi:hypothetical protein HDU79_011050, partial [Rhizoclosmatium sp. JEL0117]
STDAAVTTDAASTDAPVSSAAVTTDAASTDASVSSAAVTTDAITTDAASSEAAHSISSTPTTTEFVYSTTTATIVATPVTATVAEIPSTVAAIATGTPSVSPSAISDNSTATVFTELLQLASSSSSSDIKQSIVQIPAQAIVPNADAVTFSAAKIPATPSDNVVNQAILQLGSSAFNFGTLPFDFVVYDSVSIRNDSVKFVPIKNGFVISFLLGKNVTDDVWYALKLVASLGKTVHIDIFSAHTAIGSFDVVVTDVKSKKRRSDPVFTITSATGQVALNDVNTVTTATSTVVSSVAISTKSGSGSSTVSVTAVGASTVGASALGGATSTAGATSTQVTTTCATAAQVTTTCASAVPAVPTAYVAPGVPGSPAGNNPGSYVPPAGSGSGSQGAYVAPGTPAGNVPGSQGAYVAPGVPAGTVPGSQAPYVAPGTPAGNVPAGSVPGSQAAYVAPGVPAGNAPGSQAPYVAPGVPGSNAANYVAPTVAAPAKVVPPAGNAPGTGGNNSNSNIYKSDSAEVVLSFACFFATIILLL